MEREYYSIGELADKLSVHYNTIIKLIKTRKLTAVKIAGAWRISGIALEAYLEKFSVKAV